MKKIFLIVALVCMATVGAFAQEDSKWNVKVGVGLSNVVGSDADGCKSAFSYKVGIGYNFSISESFAVEPSLYLSNKAYKEEYLDGTINRYYAELPILAAYKISLGNEMNLVINAGPYVACGLFGSDVEWYDDYSTTNAFDLFERFEAGVQVGAKLAFDKFFVGVDFSRAFTKTVADVKAYNQGFGLSVGYSF